MWEAGPAQQVREDSGGTDGHPRSLSVKNFPLLLQDLWLGTDNEAEWGAQEKGGPELPFFLPGHTQRMLGWLGTLRAEAREHSNYVCARLLSLIPGLGLEKAMCVEPSSPVLAFPGTPRAP